MDNLKEKLNIAFHRFLSTENECDEQAKSPDFPYNKLYVDLDNSIEEMAECVPQESREEFSRTVSHYISSKRFLIREKRKNSGNYKYYEDMIKKYHDEFKGFIKRIIPDIK